MKEQMERGSHIEENTIDLPFRKCFFLCFSSSVVAELSWSWSLHVAFSLSLSLAFYLCLFRRLLNLKRSARQSRKVVRGLSCRVLSQGNAPNAGEGKLFPPLALSINAPHRNTLTLSCPLFLSFAASLSLSLSLSLAPCFSLSFSLSLIRIQ